MLIELKSGRTPREVVAQALDDATWVEQLRADEIAAIYGQFAASGTTAGLSNMRTTQLNPRVQLGSVDSGPRAELPRQRWKAGNKRSA